MAYMGDTLTDSAVRRLADTLPRGWRAAAQFAPVAPPRIVLCYDDDIRGLVEAAALQPVDAGANVALVEPFDSVVYERTSRRNAITVVAPSQIVVDLMTSPGRGPNEAEALIEWMGEHEDAWRT